MAVTYTENAVNVTAAIPGDANLDGTIDLGDLQILGDHWLNSTADWSWADFTGDGLVELADLQVIGDHWGYNDSPELTYDQAIELTGVPVPEPCNLLIIVLGLIGLRRIRSRSCSNR